VLCARVGDQLQSYQKHHFFFGKKVCPGGQLPIKIDIKRENNTKRGAKPDPQNINQNGNLEDLTYY